MRTIIEVRYLDPFGEDVALREAVIEARNDHLIPVFFQEAREYLQRLSAQYPQSKPYLKIYLSDESQG